MTIKLSLTENIAASHGKIDLLQSRIDIKSVRNLGYFVVFDAEKHCFLIAKKYRAIYICEQIRIRYFDNISLRWWAFQDFSTPLQKS